MDDDVKTKISNAAKELFGKFGFKKTSLVDIAKKIGMAKSSLFYYFSSKEELFKVVVSQELDTLKSKIQEAVAGVKKSEEKLRCYVITRMRVLRELASVYATLYDEYLDHLGFIEKARKRALEEEKMIIQGILEDGVKKGAFVIENVGLTAYAICVAVKGLEYPWITSNDNKGMEKDLNVLLNLLLRAIKKN
jgi:AcrR family transcriptional regulator